MHIGLWQGLIRKADDQATAARKRRWDDWVSKAFSEQGGSKVYRFMRGTETPAAVFVTGAVAGGPATPQQHIDVAARPWIDLWQPQEELFDASGLLEGVGRPLPGPLPSVDEFCGLLRTYRWSTAVGGDHWQPRALELLPDVALATLIRTMRIIQTLAAAPGSLPC